MGYIMHHTLAQCQSRASRHKIENSGVHEAVLYVDFSAKFINNSFEAFQDACFGQVKTSILVVVAATRETVSSPVVYKSLFFVSPVCTQDSDWVITALPQVLKDFAQETLRFFFDGGSHFKHGMLVNYLASVKDRD